MTSGQKVLLGCGITAVVTFVLLIGGCAMYIYRSTTNYPEYAKKENVYPANKELIEKVEGIIASETKLAEIQRRISTTEWPEHVLYITLKDTFDAKITPPTTAGNEPVPLGSDGDKPVEAFKRARWTGTTSYIILNGSGHGNMRGIPLVIIQKNKSNGASQAVEYTIYLEHKP